MLNLDVPEIVWYATALIVSTANLVALGLLLWWLRRRCGRPTGPVRAVAPLRHIPKPPATARLNERGPDRLNKPKAPEWWDANTNGPSRDGSDTDGRGFRMIQI